jgi:imidazolonepropionase
MSDWDLLLTDARIATMCVGAEPYGVIDNAALAIADGKLAWLGPIAELPDTEYTTKKSLEGRWLTPALIDCHTHLVFAGNRATEFEARLNGATYAEIAKSGGGIMSTVRATRDASQAALTEASERRLLSLRKEGVATIEIKSGYGLDLDTEIRMLEVGKALAKANDVSVTTTFLGVHAIPPDYIHRNADYVRFVCDEVLPAVSERGLADAVDAYCEGIAFQPDEIRTLFECATRLGIPVKLHADQLSDTGGAALAAEFKALSADHLEYTSESGVRALAEAGSVAVLLPGAFLTLRESQLPPLDALRDHGVAIAVATDCNPGTSPLCSLRSAMSLASTLFRLTPEECLAGVTREAARALGLADDRGTLEVGKRADIAVWDIDHPSELSYWLGLNQLSQLYVNGRT